MTSFECASCLKNIDGKTSYGRQLPCKYNHVFCSECFEESIEKSNGNSSECWTECNTNKKHYKCMKCPNLQAFHVNEGIGKIKIVPKSEEHLPLSGGKKDHPKCQNCTKEFLFRENQPTLLTCPKMCIICHRCVEVAIQTGGDHKQCKVWGAENTYPCDPELQHFRCPRCKTTLHKPRSGGFVSLPIDRDELEHLKLRLVGAISLYQMLAKSTYSRIQGIVDIIKSNHEESDKTQVICRLIGAGGGAGVVGGVALAAVCPPAALILSLGGAAVGIISELSSFKNNNDKNNFEKTKANDFTQELNSLTAKALVVCELLQQYSQASVLAERECDVDFDLYNGSDFSYANYFCMGLKVSANFLHAGSSFILFKDILPKFTSALKVVRLAAGCIAVIFVIVDLCQAYKFSQGTDCDLANQIERKLEKLKSCDHSFLDKVERKTMKANKRVRCFLDMPRR